MIPNFIVTTDEEDLSLGSFFRRCSDDICQLIITIPNTLIRINSKYINMAYFDTIVSQFQKPYLKIVYTHGNSSGDALVDSRSQPYVKKDQNDTMFDRTLFYAMSCNIGANLAHSLIAHKCHAFVGYSKEAHIYTNSFDIFSNCFNYGIKAFIMKKISIGQAVEEMRKNYSDEIDKIAYKHPIVAAGLLNNRDALCLLGNPDILLDDLKR
jgi:hypothetical protein